MAAERTFVDVEDEPNLAEIARAVHDSGEPVVVREGGRKLAVLRPLSPAESAYEDDPEERHKAFMELAGSMKGLIDEDMMRERDESRRMSGRTPYTIPERSDDEIAARWKRIRELAGNMKDLVPEDFVEENYRIRSESSRYVPENK